MNEIDLIEFIKLKCNLIQIKYSILLLDYLENTYLNNLIINDDNLDYKFLNLLISLIIDKQTVICSN